MSTRRAAASTRCSQLSTTKSNSLSPKASTNVSISGWPGRSGTSKALATCWATKSPSVSEASSTSHTPSG